MSEDDHTADESGNIDGGTDGEPSAEAVVEAAAEAAEDVVFNRYRRASLDDYDVSITFEDGVLEVDVFVDAGGESDEDEVAEDAALAAQAAVDDLFDTGN